MRLALCSDVGPIRFSSMLAAFGDIDAALSAPASRLAMVDRIGDRLASQIARDRESVDVDVEIETAARYGVRIVCLADEGYPPPLRAINDPPPCIYVKGCLQREDTLALAIVGSRHCSRYGAEQAERFASLAAHAGLTVVSGMARGIDTAAHRGALVGGGRTLAVLGCGLAHMYPPESGELAAEICQRGAIISELPMHVAPDSKNFPRRNRIIVGLSLGVVIVEAAKRSGALISARLASEYNREVFAVPGRIDMIQSEGCHDLIKTAAAKLVTNFTDVLEDLGEAGRALMDDSGNGNGNGEAGANGTPRESLLALSSDEESILAALGDEPAPAEAVCEATGLPPAQVAALLTSLQLKGAIRRCLGDFFERKL
jgi:DNA processing protein